VNFINTFRDRCGVEPICQTLEVAPWSYCARPHDRSVPEN